MEQFVEIVNGLTEEVFIRAPSFSGGTAAIVVNDSGMQYPFFLSEADSVVVLEYDGAFWRMESPELYTFLYDAIKSTNGMEDQPLAAGIEITLATDERLSRYSNYDEIDASRDEYGMKLLLTTDRTLRDFSLFSLIWDETAGELVVPAEGGELYRAGGAYAGQAAGGLGEFPGYSSYSGGVPLPMRTGLLRASILSRVARTARCALMEV